MKLYGGYVNGKLHEWDAEWTEAETGLVRRHRRFAIFKTKIQASREYEDVRALQLTTS